MSRSIKKGPYIEAALLKRVQQLNAANDKKVLKTWSRSSTIFPDFIGHTVAVHDGRKHVPGYGTWSDISSANLHPPAPSADMPEKRLPAASKRREKVWQLVRKSRPPLVRPMPTSVPAPVPSMYA